MLEHRPRLLKPASWTVKTKLIITACIPLLVLIPVVALLLYAAGESVYSKVLVSKVRSDLVIATQFFERLQQSRLTALQAWSESAKLRNLLTEHKGIIDAETLGSQVEQLELSYLRFIGLDGQVLSTYPLNPSSTKLGLAQLEVIRAREGMAQVILAQPEELDAISPFLKLTAEQAIVPTNNASPDGRKLEPRGLVVQAITPLYWEGRQLGWLEGGVLLNKNFAIVDNLSSLIYPSNALLDGSKGSATIFLEDVRVSTTVQLGDDRRALGTRVSDVVRQSVMGRGEVWLERAFVVNNWYWAGYAPITSPSGSRIGMLYVGFLEAPYAALKTQLLVLFLIAVSGAMFLGALLVNKLARVIFKPLGKMNAVMTRQETGDIHARVGPMRRQDEFSELSRHFDDLLDQLQSRRHELEVINAELDGRVNQRTAALHEANEKLRKAIEQLLATEKLALMGQLTAGVAHEFNNPLAIMMGHLDLLRLELADQEVGGTIGLLDAQIQRMQRIVQKLLQFCRPEQTPESPEIADVEQVINDSLLFVKSELTACQAEVNVSHNTSRSVQISSTALQQIMVNLLINASHALERPANLLFESWKPRISIHSEDVITSDGQLGVRIRVENNGPAIPPEQHDAIFRMFFTTKREGKGTGVGLSVSRMLIQRGGGNLSVESPVFVEPVSHGVAFVLLIFCEAKPAARMLLESSSLSVSQD